MWPRNNRPAVVWACALLGALPAAGGGQTIAEFSRSQRAVLQAAMVQNAARVVAAAAPPAPVAGVAPVAPAASLPAAARSPLALDDPLPVLGGVVVGPSKALAEFSVGGGSYLLGVGQQVPGTGWRVASISPGGAVLSRAAPGARPIEHALRLASAP